MKVASTETQFIHVIHLQLMTVDTVSCGTGILILTNNMSILAPPFNQASIQNYTHNLPHDFSPPANPSSRHQTHLNIDRQSSRFRHTLFGTLIFFTVVSFVIGASLPEAYLVITDSQGSCPNPISTNSQGNIQCSPFDLEKNPRLGIILRNLDDTNEYLLLKTKVYVTDITVNTVFDFSIRMTQYTLREGEKVPQKMSEINMDIVVDEEERKNRFYNNETKLMGVVIPLLYQHEIIASNQWLLVEFTGITQNPSTDQGSNIQDIQIEASVINPDFTRFRQSMRVVFFVFSITAFVMYFCQYKEIPVEKRSFEQKMITALGVLLVLYNNPLIVVLLKSDDSFLAFFIQTTNLLLPLALVIFCMATLEKADLKLDDRELILTRSVSKGVFFALFLVFSLALYLTKAYSHLVDYIGMTPDQISSISVLSYFTFFLTLISFATIVIRCINIFGKTQTGMTQPELSSRRAQTFILVSFVFMLFQVLYFLSHGFYIFSDQPTLIFLQGFQLNLYVFYLQYLYSGSHEVQEETVNSDLVVSDEQLKSSNVLSKPNSVYNFPKTSMSYSEGNSNKQEGEQNSRGNNSYNYNPVHYPTEAKYDLKDSHFSQLPQFPQIEAKDTNEMDNFQIQEPQEEGDYGERDEGEMEEIHEVGGNLRLQEFQLGEVVTNPSIVEDFRR